MADPTDEDRLAAYDACWRSYQDKINEHGLGFIGNLIAGDLLGAGYEWASIVIEKSPDCLNLLTPEQRKQKEDEYAAHAIQDAHRRRVDREPR